MESIEFLSPWYFATTYYIIFLFLCWGTVLYYVGSSAQKILHAESSPMQGVALLLTISLAFFLGLRPLSTSFGDMNMYAHYYLNIIDGFVPFNPRTEWLWDDFTYLCKVIGLNINEYFLVIAIGYFLGMFICSYLLMRKNLWLAVLFFYISFSCYSFGTNGIRNGLGCSVALIAISVYAMGGAKRPLGFLLMFIAMGVHRSSFLPCAAAVASRYIIKDTKTAIRFWLVSIAISLVAGSQVEHFLAALGFDDRMGQYASNEQTADLIVQSGFRWDFLLYSAFPVALIWYVTRYRKFTDQLYNVFAISYLLCNAFWIMVIRAGQSNRFAYLSWFIYPVVIAYPLLRMNLWKDQDRKTALILFLYSGFTLFMFFIFYFGTSNGFNGFDQYWWRQ